MDMKYPLAIVLGVALTALTIMNLWPSVTNVGVSDAAIVFAANDTYYDVPNAPIYTASPYTPTLAYENGTAVEDYTYTSTQVKIGAEVTADTYYASYTYYKQLWAGGTNYSWMVTLLVIIGIFALILKLLGII